MRALQRIESAVAAWRERVVRPLRGVRRALKSDFEHFDPALKAALRTEVKRIELEAERLQQLTLEQALTPASLLAQDGEPRACARHNVELYAGFLGASASGDFDRILAAFGSSLERGL